MVQLNLEQNAIDIANNLRAETGETPWGLPTSVLFTGNAASQSFTQDHSSTTPTLVSPSPLLPAATIFPFTFIPTIATPPLNPVAAPDLDPDTTPRADPRDSHRPPYPKPLLLEAAYRHNLQSTFTYYTHGIEAQPIDLQLVYGEPIENHILYTTRAVTDAPYYNILVRGENAFRGYNTTPYERSVVGCMRVEAIRHAMTYAVPSFTTPAQIEVLERSWNKSLVDATVPGTSDEGRDAIDKKALCTLQISF